MSNKNCSVLISKRTRNEIYSGRYIIDLTQINCTVFPYFSDVYCFMEEIKMINNNNPKRHKILKNVDISYKQLLDLTDCLIFPLT